MRQQPPLRKEKERIWEIDALRGFLILALLINHVNLTVHAFCINGYYNIDSSVWASVTDPLHVWYTYDANGVLQSAQWVVRLRAICNRPGVNTFFLLSGICCVFSRDNLRRGIRMLLAAFLVSGFTKLLALWTGDDSQFIRFGALQCYAYCYLIYHFLLENKKSKTLLWVSLPVFIIGYYLRYFPVSSDISLLVPFGIRERDVSMRDYWPLFPMLGWMLVGVVLGRKFYTDKKSLWPSALAMRITRPLQWLGRYSGPIYLLHILIYTAVFCGIGWIFNLF